MRGSEVQEGPWYLMEGRSLGSLRLLRFTAEPRLGRAAAPRVWGLCSHCKGPRAAPHGCLLGVCVLHSARPYLCKQVVTSPADHWPRPSSPWGHQFPGPNHLRHPLHIRSFPSLQIQLPSPHSVTRNNPNPSGESQGAGLLVLGPLFQHRLDGSETGSEVFISALLHHCVSKVP